LVIPSWDGYLEEYARLFTSRPENSFIFALKQWAMPPWMMPIAYQLPTIGGFEGQSAFLFEIADEQDQATTLSRLAEYFLEMGQGELAMSASRGLAIYPENLPALAALGQIELARGDGASFAATFRTLLAVYASTEEHDLSWDRRVSLAVVLMQGKRTDLARREMEIALNLMDEARLRSLSIGSLYRFQVLLKALGLKIEDGRLQALAGSLLPEALRGQL
jgi:tetratricopeptide (TPR) repeat protein